MSGPLRRINKKKVWSPTVYLVRGSGKTRSINRQYPHTCNVYGLNKHIQTSDERDWLFPYTSKVYQTF